jgi:ABC-type Na+ efflux pump permease subunit
VSTISVDLSVEEEYTKTKPLGLYQAVQVLYAPRKVFHRAEDTGAYGWALLTLLVLVFLAGYVEVQTGLIDRNVDRQTEKQLAVLEETQGHLLDRVELRDRMDAIRKTGEFNAMLQRLGVMVFSPGSFVVSFLLISAVLYAIVALTGRKPEYHTLMSICVYAGFIGLVGVLVRLGMVMNFGSEGITTSLAMIAEPNKGTLLAAVDPFRIWFWVLVCIGLIVTRQLSRRMAIVSCSLMALVTAAVHAGLSLAGQANA